MDCVIGIEVPKETGSTSALGGFRKGSPIWQVILVGGAMSGPFGPSDACLPIDSRYAWPTDRTLSTSASQLLAALIARGPDRNAALSTGAAIAELRRLSGLTWDQLAGIFGVGRRSVHFWASGKPLSQGHEEMLVRILEEVRRSDRGSAAQNRRALTTPVEKGVRPVDLLARHQYEDFARWMGAGTPTRRPALMPLSPEARAARRPPSPDRLVAED